MKEKRTNVVNLNDTAPAVSVIIPVRNGGRPFIRCLQALVHSERKPAEIIVAANGCFDRSVEVAQLCETTLIEIPQAIGPAAARNTAARMAHGEILLFLDADVAVHPDTLDRFQAFFREHTDIAACFGSYDDAPPETNFFSQYKNLFHHFIHQQANPKATTFWAGCGAIRRKVFENVGGFDERFRYPSVEDIELGYRLTAREHLIRLDKDILATHLKRWSIADVLHSDIFRRALPWARLIFRSRSAPNDLNTKSRYRLSALITAFLTVMMPLGLFSGMPLWPILFAVLLLLGLNLDWYGFALQRKGGRWTLLAIVWHWFYYLYCGATFAYAAIEQVAGYGLKKDE